MPLQGLLRILRVVEIELAYGRIGRIHLCGFCEGVDDVRIGYTFILRSHVRGMLSMISRVHVRLGLARGGPTPPSSRPRPSLSPHQTAAQNVFVVCRLDITMEIVVCSLQSAARLRMVACH